MNEDLEKKMRAALEKAAHCLGETCDMFINDGGADEDDVKDMREFARECAALAEEGVK